MAAGARSIFVLAFACGGALGLLQCGLTTRNPGTTEDKPTTRVFDAGEPESRDAGNEEEPVDAADAAVTPPDAAVVMPPLDAAVDPKPLCPEPPLMPTLPVSEHRFRMQWDYRYDSHAFLGDQARALLVEAARIWGEAVRSDFAPVPAGTEILMRNPERPDEAGLLFPIEYDIDDLALFVASAHGDGPGQGSAGVRTIAALGSVKDFGLRQTLTERYTGPHFEPWTAWLSFDVDEPWFFDPTPETDDDLPADQLDFLSVSVSMLGGALGIGGSGAFQRLLDKDGAFAGCAAMAVYGGPVPLDANHTHIQGDVVSDGRRPVLCAINRRGERNVRPTALDLAMLADIGYEVATP